MNNRKTNENMHSNSTRANFVNGIPCIMRKYPRKKTKGKTYKYIKKKKKNKKNKILVGLDLGSAVWKPNALSTRPLQTKRCLLRFYCLHNQ